MEIEPVIELSTYQAKAGYAVLTQYWDQYLPMMWLMNIERRWSTGEDLEDLIALALQQAIPWYARATGAAYPVGERQVEGVREFIEACEAEVPEPFDKLGHAG